METFTLYTGTHTSRIKNHIIWSLKESNDRIDLPLAKKKKNRNERNFSPCTLLLYIQHECAAHSAAMNSGARLHVTYVQRNNNKLNKHMEPKRAERQTRTLPVNCAQIKFISIKCGINIHVCGKCSSKHFKNAHAHTLTESATTIGGIRISNRNSSILLFWLYALFNASQSI